VSEHEQLTEESKAKKIIHSFINPSYGAGGGLHPGLIASPLTFFSKLGLMNVADDGMM